MVAERLGLSGWVKNLEDGSVELEAEGPRAVLEKLVSWCHRGPSAARVTGAEKGFEVRY
jgi:acylphosphatase